MSASSPLIDLPEQPAFDLLPIHLQLGDGQLFPASVVSKIE